MRLQLAGLEKNPPSDFKPVISNPHMRVFQNGSLAVTAVTRSDSASYLCQISNGIGSGLSKVVKLTVHGMYCTHFVFTESYLCTTTSHDLSLPLSSSPLAPLLFIRTILYLSSSSSSTPILPPPTPFRQSHPSAHVIIMIAVMITLAQRI